MWKGSLQVLDHRNLRFALGWILLLSVPVLLNRYAPEFLLAGKIVNFLSALLCLYFARDSSRLVVFGVFGISLLLSGFGRLAPPVLLISFIMILLATWFEIHPGPTEEDLKRWEEDLNREEEEILRSESSPWEKPLDLENLRARRALLLGRRGFLEVRKEFLKVWKPEIPGALKKVPDGLKKIPELFKKIIEALKRKAKK